MIRRLILALLTLAALVPPAAGSSRELYDYRRVSPGRTWQSTLYGSLSRDYLDLHYPGASAHLSQLPPHPYARFGPAYRPPGSTLPTSPEVPGNQPPEAADPVVTSVGEYNTLSRDLVLGGELLLELVRFQAAFLGQAASFWGFYPTSGSPMGWNWTHNHHMLLMRLSATSVAVYYQQGKVVFFQKSGGVWSMAPPPVGFVYMGTPYQMVVAGSKLEMMDPLTSQILTFEFSALTNGQVTGVEQVRDRNGNAHTYTYNASNNVRKVVDGQGRSLTFSYTSFGGARRVTSVTDHTGRVVTFNYNTNGTQKNATDANGHTTSYTWNNSGRLKTLTRPKGNVAVSNTINGSGQCTSQTDGEGNLWSFSYGANQTTITDPLGNQRVHQFNSLLRLTGWVDEAGNKITRTYDAKHRLKTSTDRLGHTSSVTYHQPSGQVASVTDEAGHTWQYIYEAQTQDGFTFYPLQRVEHPDDTRDHMTRDANGNVLSWRDRGGDVTSCTYDNAGRLATCTNPAGGSWTYTYDALGNPASVTDPDGDTTGLVCDAVSRLVQVALPDGTLQAYTYDPVGNLLTAADSQGDTLTYAYDDNDNLATVTLPLGQVLSYTCDGNDDVVAVTDPMGGTTTCDRDGLRNIVACTAPGGEQTTYTYDARRRRTRTTDANGEDWTTQYDDEGRVIGRAYPLDQKTAIRRDPVGNVTRLKPPHQEPWILERDADGLLTRIVTPLDQEMEIGRDREGHARRVKFGDPTLITRVDRNALDQPHRVVDPRGNSWSSDYDDAGQRVATTDPLDRTTSCTHDDLGRCDVLTLPGAMGTLDQDYDENGRLVRVQGSDGTDVQCQYDANGNLISGDGISLVRDDNGQITDCNGALMTWNANGQMTSMEVAPGSVIQYRYTPRGQVARIQDWNGQVTGFEYDAAGNWIGMTRPNGQHLRRTVDFFGNPLSIQEGTHGAILVERDGAGRQTRVDSNGPAPPFLPPLEDQRFPTNAANERSDFVYDGLSRLVSDGTTTNQWDLFGRLLSQNGPQGATQYDYDAVGNVTSIVDSTDTIDLLWNYATEEPVIVKETSSNLGSTLLVPTPKGLPVYGVLPDGSYEYYHWKQDGSLWYTSDSNGEVVQAYWYTPEGKHVGSTNAKTPRHTWRAQDGVVRATDRYFDDGEWYDPEIARSLDQSGRSSRLTSPEAARGLVGEDVVPGDRSPDTGSAGPDVPRFTGGPWEGWPLPGTRVPGSGRQIVPRSGGPTLGPGGVPVFSGGPWKGTPLPSAQGEGAPFRSPSSTSMDHWNQVPASSPAQSDYFEEFRPLANSYMEFTKGATLPGDLSQLFFPRHTPAVLTVTPPDPDCASDDRN